jgi:hypothetical protein
MKTSIKVGTKIEITAKATRKDGLVEKQVVIVEVKEVTKSYFKWSVVEVVTAENVLMPLTGGMSMFGNIEFLFTKGGYKLV